MTHFRLPASISARPQPARVAIEAVIQIGAKKRMKTCWHFYFLANLVANSDGQIFRVFEIGAKSFIGFERGPRFRCSIERHLAVNVVTVLCVPISIGAVAPDSNIEIWGFSSDWRQ